jgi:hypothetical protein
MSGCNAVEIANKFWELMGSNNFRSVGAVLSDDFVLDWPQSNERIRGRDNFAAMNEEYPAHGRWTFTINRIFGNDFEAVSDVSVTDGVQHARAVSFFVVKDDKIASMVEYWPDNYPAPENRKHLVEKIDSPIQ